MGELISFRDNYLTNKKGIKIVDFGCSDMPYKSFFKDYNYIGIDIEGNDLADGVVDFDSNSSLDNEVCEVILSTQVLEHVRKPDNYLKECHRMLKKDGLLVLSTHGHWIYHGVPTDFWRWTSDGLKEVIKEQGFEIIEFNGLIGAGAIGIQILQDKLYQRLKILPRVPIFTPLFQGIIIMLDKLHSKEGRNKDAGIFFVVAKKK